jgi:hypothetical protein
MLGKKSLAAKYGDILNIFGFKFFILVTVIMYITMFKQESSSIIDWTDHTKMFINFG